jgi:hypothetical protein
MKSLVFLNDFNSKPNVIDTYMDMSKIPIRNGASNAVGNKAMCGLFTDMKNAPANNIPLSASAYDDNYDRESCSGISSSEKVPHRNIHIDRCEPCDNRHDINLSYVTFDKRATTYAESTKTLINVVGTENSIDVIDRNVEVRIEYDFEPYLTRNTGREHNDGYSQHTSITKVPYQYFKEVESLNGISYEYLYSLIVGSDMVVVPPAQHHNYLFRIRSVEVVADIIDMRLILSDKGLVFDRGRPGKKQLFRHEFDPINEPTVREVHSHDRIHFNFELLFNNQSFQSDSKIVEETWKYGLDYGYINSKTVPTFKGKPLIKGVDIPTKALIKIAPYDARVCNEIRTAINF